MRYLAILLALTAAAWFSVEAVWNEVYEYKKWPAKRVPIALPATVLNLDRALGPRLNNSPVMFGGKSAFRSWRPAAIEAMTPRPIRKSNGAVFRSWIADPSSNDSDSYANIHRIYWTEERFWVSPRLYRFNDNHVVNWQAGWFFRPAGVYETGADASAAISGVAFGYFIVALLLVIFSAPRRHEDWGLGETLRPPV